MAETVLLDPSGVAINRTELDITPWMTDAGADWGDAEISAYMADSQAVGASVVGHRLPNRKIKIPLKLRDRGGVAFATIRSQLQRKIALIQREGGWLQRSSSPALYADVVNATLHMGGDWMEAFRSLDVDVTLEIEALPDFYGDEVVLDTLSGTTAITGVLLQTGGTAVVGGDYPGRCRLVAVDTSGNDQKGLIWGFRSRNYSSAVGAALSYEAEAMTALNGAAGSALSGASGGTVVVHNALPPNVWASVLYTNLTAGSAPMTHTGNYRVWARAYSGSATPSLRLQWGQGGLAVPVTNEAQILPVSGAFCMVDLGSVSLQTPPVGSPKWFGAIQANVAATNDQVAIDRIFFQPLDETAGVCQYTSVPPTSSLAPQQTAGSAVEDASYGTLTWNNPGGALTPGVGASTSVTGTTWTASRYLKLTSLGFAIPSGATIKGVKVSLWIKVDQGPSGGGYGPFRVRLVKAGTPTGTGPANPNGVGGSGPWFWNLNSWEVGEPTDLWGATLSPTDVNNSGFGFVFSIGLVANAGGETVTGWVGAPQIVTVYYTLASGFTIAQDAVIYASGTAELRTEGMYRADASGNYGPMSQVTGDLPRIPPSGNELRAVQLFAKTTRGGISESDAGLDGFSVQTRYRPSYLFRP